MARRVHAELAEVMEADWFESSTAEFLGKSFGLRLVAPFAAIRNSSICKRLRKAQRERDYVAWEIHNIFSARVACAAMGITLTRVRRLKVFEKVAAWIVLSDAQKQLHLHMGLPEKTLHIVPHFLPVQWEKPSEIPEEGYVCP